MYIYINSQFKNNTDILESIVSYEQRQDNIVPANGNFLLSVDRWFIEGGYFPIFQVPSNPLYIKINNQLETINFTSNDTIYNGDFIYSMDDFMTPINESLSNFNLGLSLSFDYDKNLFSLNSSSSQNLNINMDLKLGSYLLFDNMKIINNEWLLSFSGTSIQQSITSIDNLCPVIRISIESTDLPCVPELLPAENNLVSRNTSNIISDYKYLQNDISPIKNILYNADGNHRWQNIINGISNFKNIRLSYFFFDYNNNKYPVQVLSGGIGEAKLLFKNDLD